MFAVVPAWAEPDASLPPPAMVEGAASPPASSPPPAPLPPASSPPLPAPDPLRPPPLHVEYAQYGVALTATMPLSTGATCSSANPPCILGAGGGLAIRGGFRSSGPWYIGGAYEFTKMDSGNLYRLGIFQQLRFEMRYLPDTGYRTAPFMTWGVGGLAYGNEWGVETGGALLFFGGGIEVQISRVALLGLALLYRPALIAGWIDTAGIERPLGLAQFLGIELQLELRSETGRK